MKDKEFLRGKRTLTKYVLNINVFVFIYSTLLNISSGVEKKKITIWWKTKEVQMYMYKSVDKSETNRLTNKKSYQWQYY